MMKIAKDTSIKVSGIFPPEKSDEITIPLVESIAFDIPRVFQVNIPNRDNFIPGIPQDFEVEIPALVSKRGIQGIKTDGLPGPLISYILRDRVAPTEVELKAYESGEREMLLQLILMDPWTKSEKQAKDLLEDILALPHHEEMPKHYK